MANLISKEYLHQLKTATEKVWEYCELLNQEESFLNLLNEKVTIKKENKLLYKVQRFFLSDCIYVFSKVKNISPSAQLGMAYYYDVLRNQKFSSTDQAEIFQKLVSTNDFKNHFNAILQENILFDLSDSKTFLLTLLKKEKHEMLEAIYASFVQFLVLVCEINSLEADDSKGFFGIDFKNLKKNEIENDSLDSVLEELNSLIGLEEVKKDVAELVNLLKVQRKRREQGLKNIEITLHTVFLGPPGTGKTTVARLLGRIFKQLDFLSKGQLIETDREGMVAGYVGQTATKVDQIIEESKGGVLFVDEAYALSQNIGNDYGAEAVNTLLKRMEDYREDLAVVVAGYDEPMEVFINSNPGLRSRFNRYFYFNHFTPSELIEIFELNCKKSDFILDEIAKEKLQDIFEILYEKRDEGFGNARVVRNIFEKCVQQQANRVVKYKRISKKKLKTLLEEDIPEAGEIVKQVYNKDENE